MYIIARTFYIAFSMLSAGAHQALAQTFINPLSTGSDLDTLLERIVEIVIFILIPIIILMLVYTGFLFVQAQGNPAKLSEAKKVFVWTLVGAFVILAAETLKDAIVETANSL